MNIIYEKGKRENNSWENFYFFFVGLDWCVGPFFKHIFGLRKSFPVMKMVVMIILGLIGKHLLHWVFWFYFARVLLQLQSIEGLCPN